MKSTQSAVKYALVNPLAWLLVTSLLLSSPASGSDAVISDLLIALDSDGRSHTVQHTIASDGALLRVSLPGSVIPLDVRFMGPERATFDHAWRNAPKALALWSGSAFVRYRHQYFDAVTQLAPGHFELAVISIPDNLDVEDGTLDLSSTTWVFPIDYDILNYTVTDSDSGRWIAENNTLTFTQSGSTPLALTIEYRRRGLGDDEPLRDLCAEGDALVDACAPDDDRDGTPDYRDVCVNPEAQPVNAPPADKVATDATDLGCDSEFPLILGAISFATGQSYLDLAARRLLDRVAAAAQRYPERYFEVAAHTDNQGTRERNQRLSQRRADAARHYLMLRGVGPNQIRATGYGESQPVGDNTTAEGARRNRRIELRPLSQ